MVDKPISYILADSNYSVFHYTDGTKLMASITLKKLEDKGIRIHRSVVINPEQIRQILTHGAYYVQMNDSSLHRVARDRVKYFLDVIEKLKEA